PRPAGGDPRIRGGRPGADAPPRRRDHADPGSVAGPLLLGRAVPRGHVPRLPADVGPGGAARAPHPPAQFAPFTGTEWTSLGYEGATACLRWPGPRRPEPPVDPAAPYPN